MEQLGRIVHDIRNLLTLLDRATSKLTPPEGAASCPQEIASQATALATGIDHLKGLLREIAGLSMPMIDEVCLLTAATFRGILAVEVLPTLGKIYGLAVALDDAPPTAGHVVANRRHCQRILENLISNAAQAGATRVTVSVRAHDHTIDLVVRDNGRGMTDEQIQALGFGFTTKDESGHGQGFRLVRKLASEFGAEVKTPRSIPGIGTEVIIAMLRRGAALRATTEAARPERSPHEVAARDAAKAAPYVRA